jgi:hypothetical protein
MPPDVNSDLPAPELEQRSTAGGPPGPAVPAPPPTVLGKQKELAAEELGSVARALRVTARQLQVEHRDVLSPYAEKAARYVDTLAQALRRKDLGTIITEMEGFARRRPGLFLGGAALAGFLCARFLKVGRPRAAREPDPAEERHGAGT